MSREIKFRYWNPFVGEGVMVNNPEMPHKEGWTIEQIFSDRGWVWQQYTERKDKNGKDVFEGDVIQINSGFRETQTHYGENIPHPSGQYTESLEPAIKTKAYEVKFDDGMFYINPEHMDGKSMRCPLSWEADELQVTDLCDIFGGITREWSDDLEYLLAEYGLDSAEQLAEHLSSFLVIGNIYENPELLDNPNA